jgi:hypothetical protein
MSKGSSRHARQDSDMSTATAAATNATSPMAEEDTLFTRVLI